MLAEFETSGLMQKEFVAKHDLPFNTFQYWLYKKRKMTESGSSPRFLPVEVVTVAAPKARQGGAALLEADLRGGVTIRFPVGTDIGYLAELLSALG